MKVTLQKADEDAPLFLIVDLFCGAGGTSCGFAAATLPKKLWEDAELTELALKAVTSSYLSGSIVEDVKERKKIAKVIACVNHDPIAIKSHWANHPEVKHFEEDIRTLDLTGLIAIVNYWREVYPNALLILWASLECTNFSKAKGGQPRDADSRTLAEHLERYITALNPDYVQIENVVEFMSWGPLDDNGKPVSRKNGSDWMRWRKEICDMGYVDDWKELNSANFGAYTSRNRLFGCFAKPGLPIVWPDATHSKKPTNESMYGCNLKKWKPVKDVLNFEDEGESIFNRKKPLSDKTFERIMAGLIKYVANGDKAFISKYYSGRPAGKNIPINGPAGTVTCVDGQALVQTKFLMKYNSMNKNGVHTPPSVEEPAPTISTQVRMGLVQTQFLAAYYGTGDNVSPVSMPCPVVPTKDRFNLVQPQYFIDKHFSNNGNAQNQSIHEPAGTILTNDKHRLVEAMPFVMPTNFDNKPTSIEDPLGTITANRKHHYIVNPSHGGCISSTNAPCPVIVARQDKAPLYLIQAEKGNMAIPVYDYDTEIVIKIKHFMVAYGLADIKMRMLRVPELKKIQGFPDEYILEGTQADQKKFIGNSVVPQVVKSWVEAIGLRIPPTVIEKYFSKKKAA